LPIIGANNNTYEISRIEKKLPFLRGILRYKFDRESYPQENNFLSFGCPFGMLFDIQRLGPPTSSRQFFDYPFGISKNFLDVLFGTLIFALFNREQGS
jgi:hypothetical protein